MGPVVTYGPDGVADFGWAGPFRLTGHLLDGGLTGGGLAEVYTAVDLEGRPLVAKCARIRADGSGTEVWAEEGGRRLPVHLPASPKLQDTGGTTWVPFDLSSAELEEILIAEAEVLERDGGLLFPRSFGVWPHEPSGRPMLVMERLVGRRPTSVGEVAAVLEALDNARQRGVLRCHGDLKLEHIFIDDEGAPRLCDPAPQLGSGRRAFTMAYNPAGRSGVAADVTACASMLRFLGPFGPPERDAPDGVRWVSQVLGPEPPTWILDHANAASALRAEPVIGAVEVGWERTSAVGGGGGEHVVWATTASHEVIVSWLHERRSRLVEGLDGDETFEDMDDGWGWRVTSERGGWRTTSIVDVMAAGPGVKPFGAREDLIPKGATYFISAGHLSTPEPKTGPSGQLRRRRPWWRLGSTD